MFCPPEFFNEPTPRDDIPNEAPFINKLAAWSPLQLITPDFFHPGDVYILILPIKTLPSHHVSRTECETLSKSISEEDGWFNSLRAPPFLIIS